MNCCWIRALSLGLVAFALVAATRWAYADDIDIYRYSQSLSNRPLQLEIVLPALPDSDEVVCAERQAESCLLRLGMELSSEVDRLLSPDQEALSYPDLLRASIVRALEKLIARGIDSGSDAGLVLILRTAEFIEGAEDNGSLRWHIPQETD